MADCNQVLRVTHALSTVGANLPCLLLCAANTLSSCGRGSIPRALTTPRATTE
jgi:hypothetical protein